MDIAHPTTTQPSHTHELSCSSLPPAAASYQRIHHTILKNTRSYTILLCLPLILGYLGLIHAPSSPLHGPTSPSSSTCLKIFFFCNGFSLFSSLSGLLLSSSLTFSPFILTYLQQPASLEKQTEIQLKHLAITLPKVAYIFMFLTLSLAFCVVGFISAELAAVRNLKSARLELLVPCAVGGLALLQSLIRSGIDFWREIQASHVELWETLKEQTLFGDIFTQYVEFCSSGKAQMQGGQHCLTGPSK